MSPSLLVEFTVNFTLRVIPIFWGLERQLSSYFASSPPSMQICHGEAKAKWEGENEGEYMKQHGALSDSAV